LTGQTFNVSGSASDPTYGGFNYGTALTLNSGMALHANSNWEYIFGSGTSITQNAGSTNNTPNLYMGSTGSGTAVAATQYNLNGGSLTVTGSTLISISGGYAGPLAAVFMQTGGTASFATLGVGQDGAGTYSLSAGTATVSGIIQLYSGGVLHQSGGTLAFPVLTETGGTANFDTGLNVTSSTVTLSGGSLTASSITGSPSNIHWTGGTLGLSGQAFDVSTTTDPAYGGYVWGSSLTLNSGMSLNETGPWEFLFGSGSSITQNAGSSNSTAYLYAGSSGTGASPVHYTLAGGSLSVSVSAFIGYVDPAYSPPGAATFTQSSGTSSFGALALGGSGTATATATLSAGTMSVTGVMSLSSGSTFHQSGGVLSFATFNQSGGTSNFDVGLNLVSSTVNLSGGSLTASTFTVNGTTPNLNWAGGSLTITGQPIDFGTPGTDPINRAIVFGNSLTMNSGMSLSVTNSSKWEWLFGNGSTVTQNTGSSNTTPVLYMGATPGTATPDQYNMAGGLLVATNVLDVGYATGYPTTGSSGAVFTQTGGNVDTASLNVGLSGPGTYSLSSGTLDALGSISVYTGGVFHQSGGVVTFPAFNESGGTVNLDNGLNILTATYTLSGGSLTTPTITSSTVGPSNLVWTGGSLTLTEQQFNLATTPDFLNQGFIYANSLTLNSAMSLTVSNAPEVLYGNGSTITQTGATNSAYGLVVSSTGTTPGQYNLNFGSLSVTHDAYVGEVTILGGPGGGNFIQSGGTATIGGTLFLGVGGASSQYQLSGGGNLQVNAKIDMKSSATLTMATNAGMVSTPTLSNSGIIQMNGGSLSVTGGTTNNGSFTQTGGTATLGTLSGNGSATVGVGSSGNPFAQTIVTSLTQNSVTVGAGGIFDVHSGSNFDNTVNSLSITGTGQFDLANNHMFINYGSGADPITSIIGLLATGYDGGYWLAQGGIDSSTADGTPGYSLGYADSADPGNPAGLASGTIEIKYTLLGDADLNGIVNGVDFGILAANFNHGVSRWDQGDFNYDNVVNGIDFGFLAANFNKGASGASDFAALEAFAQANGLMADVPEPGVGAVVLVAGAGIFARRRKRSV
jgi:hypothetical protein